jgi:hypothetical protein
VFSSHLQKLLMQARVDDFRRAGAAGRRRPPGRAAPHAHEVQRSVTLRFGFPDDAEAIARLAALDSASAPAQPVLLAEVDGELRAALSLSDGAVVADPFYATLALVELLRARSRQLESENSAAPAPAGQRARFGLPAWR